MRSMVDGEHPKLGGGAFPLNRVPRSPSPYG